VERRPDMPRYLEKRRRRWYATLDIPKDVRQETFNGKPRFMKSLETESLTTAERRVGVLISGWKSEIEAARRTGSLDPLEADIRWWRKHLPLMPKGPDRDAELDHLLEKAARMDAKNEGAGASFYKRATGQIIGTGDHIEEWLKTLTNTNAPKTLDIKRSDTLRLARQFPLVSAIKKREVQRWVYEMADPPSGDEKPQKPKSISRILSHCRGYWSYLQSLELTGSDETEPFHSLKGYQQRKGSKAAKADERRAFKADAVVSLLRKAQGNAQRKAPLSTTYNLPLLIWLGMWTGCRIEELCSLRCEKVHLDGETPYFEVEDAKTHAGRRRVPIHSKLGDALKEAMRDSTDGYIIPGLSLDKYGDRSNAIGMRFGALKRGMGFGPQYVFHSCRKTVATLLQQAGVSEDVAAGIMGHDIPTMSYGLYSEGAALKQMAEAIERIDYPL